jgi:hypothetical protein
MMVNNFSEKVGRKKGSITKVSRRNLDDSTG